VENKESELMIGYVFIAFPKITETFTLREILELQKLGVRLTLFSLLKPKPDTLIHPEAEVLAKQTYYSSWVLSFKLLYSHLYYFLNSPIKYLHLLLKVALGSVGQPVEFAKTIAVFPKCVYFAYIARKLGLRHIHSNFASHNATCAMIMAELNQIQYSVTTHAYDIIYDKPLLRQRLLNAIFNATISEFNVRLIKERYGDQVSSRTHLIRCGIDLEIYRPREVPLGDNAAFKILCIASLRPVKGHTFLLKAIARMKAQGRKVQCILVGDGPLRKNIYREIESLNIKDVVTMVGNQTQHNVLKWLHEADCVVLSSLREGIPISLMEAMACGLPVVTTNSSHSMSELVMNNKNGLVVEKCNPDALASALSFIQDNPSTGIRFGKTGREIVEEKYDLKKNVRKLFELFINFINNRA
jgi:colanic acid/amylovoran biosynthesis glycosyltransferase